MLKKINHNRFDYICNIGLLINLFIPYIVSPYSWASPSGFLLYYSILRLKKSGLMITGSSYALLVSLSFVLTLSLFILLYITANNKYPFFRKVFFFVTMFENFAFSGALLFAVGSSVPFVGMAVSLLIYLAVAFFHFTKAKPTHKEDIQ